MLGTADSHWPARWLVSLKPTERLAELAAAGGSVPLLRGQDFEVDPVVGGALGVGAPVGAASAAAGEVLGVGGLGDDVVGAGGAGCVGAGFGDDVAVLVDAEELNTEEIDVDAIARTSIRATESDAMLDSWHDRRQRLLLDVSDERFRRRGVPALAVDHDRVDLDSQVCFHVAACRANCPQRGFADHSDVDVIRVGAGFARKAACPRTVDKRVVHTRHAAQSVSETSHHADGLQQYGTELRGPRQTPIWADELVAANRSGYVYDYRS